jgi:hypothetical protein
VKIHFQVVRRAGFSVHSDIKTTLIYAKPNMLTLEQAVKRLEGNGGMYQNCNLENVKWKSP